MISAANLDAGSIKSAILNIIDNQDRTTIKDAINQLGFDYTSIFDIYDKVLLLIKNNSRYSMTNFMKEYVMQPSNIIDDLVNTGNAIIVDGKASYANIEKLIFTIIKFVSNIARSVISFTFKILGMALGQLTAIFDFNSKGLNDRINDVTRFIDNLIEESEHDKEYYEDVKKYFTDFRDRGLNVSNLLDNDEEIMGYLKLGKEITNPTKPLLKAITDSDPKSDLSICIKFVLNVLGVLKNSQGKFSDIEKEINQLPDFVFGIELKAACQHYYKYILQTLPKSILEEKISAYLPDAVDLIHSMFDVVNTLHNNLDKELTNITGIKEPELKTLCEKVASWTGDSEDIFSIIATVMAYFEMGTPENCTYAAETAKKVIGKGFYILSKLSSNSEYPFTLIFNTISGRSEKYSTLFNKKAITLKEFAKTIYQPLETLVNVVHEVTSRIKSDLTISEVIALVPKTFLNLDATIDKLKALQGNGYTHDNVTLPMIVDCITIGDKLKAGGNSFNDLVPLKLAVDASKAIKDTPPDQLTTKVVCNALEHDSDLITLKISNFEGKLTSEQTSLASLTKTFTNFDFSESFSSISNLAGKIANKEIITTNDVETTVKTVVEDAQQHTPKNPTPKKLSSGAIAGIVIGCIAAVAIIVVVIIVVIRRKNDDSEISQKP